MNINLMAPINQLGYGVASINILKALQDQCNVSLHVIGEPQVTSKEDLECVQKALKTARFFDPEAQCVKIWHQNQMATFVGCGKHIGFPIFELDTFTDVEKHNLQSCDELFVCSKWAQGVVEEQKCGTPQVVPLGVDMKIFKPSPPTVKDKVVFFNCGKWEVRKGHDILIEAFKIAHKANPNIELWMMNSNPFLSSKESTRWRELYNHPGVKLIPRAETQLEVYNIMLQTDCGVFPSRAEGWNLELLEMMATGRHVITTNYSAHTEFCNDENSTLLEVEGVEPAFDNKWFFGQGNWGKLSRSSIDYLASKMCSFAKSYSFSINEAGVETAKRFSWKNAATSFLQGLQNV